MTHASLFSGVGGFDLAAEWMGWDNIFQVEIDPFCTKVLEKNFPNVKRYGDIRQFNGTEYRGTIDVLTAGTPCQPASTAGKRGGKSDDRWLWGETFKVVRQVQPRWVVLENVRGLLSLEQGVVFEELCVELENCGYEIRTFIIPACAVNAPHRRERIWILGYSKHVGLNGSKDRKGRDPRINGDEGGTQQVLESPGSDVPRDSITDSKLQRPVQCQLEKRPRPEKGIFEGSDSDAPNAECEGHEGQEYQKRQDAGHHRRAQWDTHWIDRAAELCRLDDGLPVELGEFKRSKAAHRNEQIKAYGNAIVPNVAYQIFKFLV